MQYRRSVCSNDNSDDDDAMKLPISFHFGGLTSTVHFSSCKLITKQTHILLRLAINFTLALTRPMPLNLSLYIKHFFFGSLFMPVYAACMCAILSYWGYFWGGHSLPLWLCLPPTHTHYTQATQWKWSWEMNKRQTISHRTEVNEKRNNTIYERFPFLKHSLEHHSSLHRIELQILFRRRHVFIQIQRGISNNLQILHKEYIFDRSESYFFHFFKKNSKIFCWNEFFPWFFLKNPLNHSITYRNLMWFLQKMWRIKKSTRTKSTLLKRSNSFFWCSAFALLLSSSSWQRISSALHPFNCSI